MNIEVRAYTDNDIEAMVTIWNQVVEDGEAFPQEECLTQESGTAFFAEQTYCGVAEDMDTGRIYGMYILHPNNVGRCGHICNASYAVDRESRGLHIGEKLVSDCPAQGKAHGYRVYSSMRLSQVMCMHDTCMSGLDSNSLARYRVVSA